MVDTEWENDETWAHGTSTTFWHEMRREMKVRCCTLGDVSIPVFDGLDGRWFLSIRFAGPMIEIYVRPLKVNRRIREHGILQNESRQT